MKKVLQYIVVASLCFAPLVYITGCGSTPAATANNSNALLITSVNAGMTTWASYVNAGKATQAQVDSVKSAYATYYNAELIFKAALEKSITTTNSVDLATVSNSMNTAETALIALLNQYLNKH